MDGLRRICGLVTLALAALLTLPSPANCQSDDDEPLKWPNIKEPGMDLGDFPNSAYTLPAGTSYLEFMPFATQGANDFQPAAFFSGYLLRYGLTDDVEFRVFGQGLTVVDTDPDQTGFSPINLDMKVHLWEDRREWCLPAVALEVALSTDWGSSFLSNGYLPTIQFNFDFPITKALNFEWTMGYQQVMGIQNLGPGQQLLGPPIYERDNEVFFQWAFEQDITERIQLFFNGSTNSNVPGVAGGTLVGCGGFFQWSDRLMFFTALNWGLTREAPDFSTQLGFGIALGSPRRRMP